MIEQETLAKHYDNIYEGLDYDSRSQKIIELNKKYNQSKGNLFLDVACGTGTHISKLENVFDCTGIDISGNMLDIAKKKSPSSTFNMGNMVNFNLKKEFNLLTCLFNSMNYLDSQEEFKSSISNFYKHLKVDGLAIFELFTTDNNFLKQFNSLRTYSNPSTKIARISEIKSIKNDQVTYELNYLISQENKTLINIKETFTTRIFSKEFILETLKDNNFQTTYLKKGFYGNGLFLGVKK